MVALTVLKFELCDSCIRTFIVVALTILKFELCDSCIRTFILIVYLAYLAYFYLIFIFRERIGSGLGRIRKG